jgi:hypothetical protein
MIQGDRSYLKASLTRGILDMQNRLIKLYVVNLQAIGTQAAFIAGFSFLGKQERGHRRVYHLTFIGIGSIIMPKTGEGWNGLHWMFDSSIHITFCLCLFMTSHAMLITVHAPSRALKGVDFEVVSTITRVIQQHKYFILWLGAIAITTLFIASMMNYWAKLVWQVSVLVTFVNIVGFVFVMVEGLRVYNIFHPDQELYFSDLFRGKLSLLLLICLLPPPSPASSSDSTNHLPSFP